jgi:hypothetical protein
MQPGPTFPDFHRQRANIAHQAEVRLYKLDLVMARRFAQFAYRDRTFFGVAADDDEADPLTGQNTRDRLADSIRSAGHQRNTLCVDGRAHQSSGRAVTVDLHQAGAWKRLRRFISSTTPTSEMTRSTVSGIRICALWLKVASWTVP